MFQEKRPTCVTVIGWAWAILGALMIIVSTLTLLASHLQPKMVGSPDSYTFQHLPEFAVVQIFVGALGLLAGVNFLKRKEWSRVILTGLSFLSFVSVLCVAIFFLFTFRAMAHGPLSSGFNIFAQLMGLTLFALYAVPLGIMFCYLRGEKVRRAMNGPA